MLQFWKGIWNELLAGERVALLYVLYSNGSSPGRQGFHQFVSTSGHMQGSIGGGVMEQKLIDLAADLLKQKHFAPFLKHQIHQSNIEKNKSGMICSGEQIVAFYSLDKNHIQTIEGILGALNLRSLGFFMLTENGFFLENSSEHSADFLFQMESTSQWIYRERINKSPSLFIFGGGHVGLALSRLMVQLEFDVHVIDDRTDLNTMKENEAANKQIVKSYAEASSLIPDQSDVYVVIMTTGYRSDQLVLRALLAREFKYIGLLGSKEKIKRLFAELKAEGFSEEQLTRVHAPIGLNIHSKTPNEIAVSIAAQIIQIRNE